MFATPEELRQMTGELTTSIWTAAALASIFERRELTASLREPRTFAEIHAACNDSPSAERVRRCLEVGVAVGVIVKEGDKYCFAPGAMPFAQEPMRRSISGDLRTQLHQAVAYLNRMTGQTREPVGWYHDATTLQAQGDASMVLAPMLKMRLAPMLGDLSQRLEAPDARFLDVGVGVGSLAIAMARVFPSLKIVGLDVFDTAIAIARENVDGEKLTDRIELRQCSVTDMRDEGVFTLAWVPAFFIADMEGAAARVHEALLPGGFVLCGMFGESPDAHRRAVDELVKREWAGTDLPPAGVEAALTKAGFTEVKRLPSPPSLAMIVGRKKP